MNGENHRLLREMLGAFALGQLSEAERTSLRAHLDGCSECRAELAYISPAAGLLRNADPRRVSNMPAPPVDLGDDIVAAVRAERSKQAVEPPQQDELAARRRRRTPRVLTAAAVVAGLAFAGVGGYLVSPKPAEIPLEPVAIQQQAPGVSAEAGVVPHTWGMEIKLTGQGFRKGEPYQVRVMRSSGDVATAGAFVGTGTNEMNCNLNSAVLREDASGFAVLNKANRVVLESSF